MREGSITLVIGCSPTRLHIGSPIARNALAAEAGLDVAVAPNASLGISWTGQFADQSHDNAVKGNFVWRF